MLALNLYIHASAFIASDFREEPDSLRLSAREPDYGSWIQPMQIRRMSKAVRMGIGAANDCLRSSGIKLPGGIVVATTTGCLQDTEAFLKKMVMQEEQMLTPTSFIQSTHNTIAGQIALMVGCKAYNNTISQHGHSFEGALMACALYLMDHPALSVLCGGVDELTDTSFHLMQRAGLYAAPAVGIDAGGEGAAFLLLNRNEAGASASVKNLQLFSGMKKEEILLQIRACLDELGADPSRDGLWIGSSGAGGTRAIYDAILKDWDGPAVRYKEQTGEWGTVIATTLARIVQAWPEGRQRILIINHYCEDWSVILLEKGR